MAEGPIRTGAAIRRDLVPLAVILLVALALRLVNLNWDEDHHLHPDERFISMVAAATTWPSNVGEYFNTAESPLNPANRNFPFFVYGTLPLFLGKAIAGPLGWDTYDKLFLLGRGLSALFDTGTVLLVYLLGITLYCRRTALLGAAFMALAVHGIQLAHFYAFDTFTVFFTTLTLYYGVRLMRGSPTLDWVWLGLAFGAALACKSSVLWLPLAFGAGIAVTVFAPRDPRRRPLRALEARLPRDWSFDGPLTRAVDLDIRITRHAPALDDQALALRERLVWGAAGLAVTMVVAFVAFRVFNPYAFDATLIFGLKPNAGWIAAIDQQRQAVEGVIDMPPSHQYAFTPAYIFPIKDFVLWGVGVPLGLAAIGGTLFAAWEVWRRRRFEHLPLLIWVGLNFLYYGRPLVKSMRYFYPLYPLLVLLAAYGLVQLYDWARRRSTATRAVAAPLTAPTSPAAATDFSQTAPIAAPNGYSSGAGPAAPPSPTSSRPGELISTEAAQQPAHPGAPIPTPETHGTAATASPHPRVAGAASTTPQHRGVGEARVGGALAPGTRLLRLAGSSAWAVVLAGTLIYALAFTSIYLRPMTRIAASEWIYANVPAGATVANEHWDDALPLPLGPARTSDRFRGVTMNLYHEDNPAKRDELLRQLDEVDYIFLTSNRLYGSIPRLPMRYPLTTEYYRRLFDGSLGFRLAAEFKAHPTFLGLTWNDDRGMEVGGLRGFLQPDEAFTVYDHPPVLIFVKDRAAYNPAAVRRLLERVPLDDVVTLKPVDAMRAKNLTLLPEALRERLAAGGTWRTLFDAAGPVNAVPLLALLLLVEVLGLAAFLLLLPVLRPLADRGYGIAKALGILFLAYPVWALAAFGIVPDTRATLAVLLTLLVAGAAFVAYRHQGELRALLRRRWRALLLLEGIFLVGYLGFALVRASNPDLWHAFLGGEKPMDLAYLTAVLKSERFPAYDPWFAGGVLNYYAYGFVLVGSLAKLLGMLPSNAYNTAVPLWYALTASAAAGVAYSLGILVAREVRHRAPALAGAAPADTGRRFWPGFCAMMAAVATVLLGNLGEFALLWDALWKLGERSASSGLPVLGGILRVLRGGIEWVMRPDALPVRNEWYYWNPTRVIPEAITEFPFFTFLYGDLHAHMLALPFQFVALGLALNLALGLSRRSVSREATEAPLTRWVGGAAGAATPGWAAARQALTGATRASARLGITQRFSVAVPPPAAAGPVPATPVVAPRTGPAGSPTDAAWRIGALDWLRLSLAALVLAVLWMTNTWDLPTYAGISAVALAATLWWTRRPPSRSSADGLAGGRWAWSRLALCLVTLGALTYVFAYPFTKDYSSFYGTVSLWKGKHTLPVEFFTLNGITLTLLTVWALMRLAARHGRGRVPARGWGLLDFWPWLVGLAALALLCLRFEQPLLAFLLPLVPLALAGALDDRAGPAERLIHALFLAGLGLALAPEVIVLDGDVGRMNTVFKLYLQLWCLWALATALALPWLIRGALALTGDLGLLARAGLAVALLLGLLYPLFAAPARANDRFMPTPPTLDGEAFMRGAVWSVNNQPIPLADDYAAIQWLREHVDGSPAIVEASGQPYTWQNRVTMFTGLPGVIGWDNHQRQQRGAGLPGAVERRLQDVRAIYTDATTARTLELLRRYGVRYVYLGALERALYGPNAQVKFDALLGQGLSLVYDQGGVRIYEVQSAP